MNLSLKAVLSLERCFWLRTNFHFRLHNSAKTLSKVSMIAKWFNCTTLSPLPPLPLNPSGPFPPANEHSKIQNCCEPGPHGQGVRQWKLLHWGNVGGKVPGPQDTINYLTIWTCLVYWVYWDRQGLIIDIMSYPVNIKLQYFDQLHVLGALWLSH